MAQVSTRRTWSAFAISVAMLTACGGSDDAADVTVSPTTAAAVITVAPTVPAAVTTVPTPPTNPPTTPAVTEPPPTEPPPTEPPPEPLQILVTNDDGFDAEGIAALVDGLLTLENVVVTVVAPATNQSGSGGKTTAGELVVAAVETASGYPAKSVAGFPADSIVWALDQKGIDFVPDLVISGINEGQNFGPFVDLSGTVGAARAAARHNIPAIAISAGFGNDTFPENYPGAVDVLLEFLTENIEAIAAHEEGEPVDEVLSINVPTCTNGGETRGVQEQPLATEIGQIDFVAGIDCESTLDEFTNDVDAFMNGFITFSPTPLEPATPPG